MALCSLGRLKAQPDEYWLAAAADALVARAGRLPPRLMAMALNGFDTLQQGRPPRRVVLAMQVRRGRLLCCCPCCMCIRRQSLAGDFMRMRVTARSVLCHCCTICTF